MLPLVTQIHFHDIAVERRRGQRHPIGLPVGGEIRAVVEDISETGLALSSNRALGVADVFEIELPVAGKVCVTVIWAEGGMVGGEFLAPITRAAVSAARLRSPRAPAELPAVEPLIIVGSAWADAPPYGLTVGVAFATALVGAMFAAALLTGRLGLS